MASNHGSKPACCPCSAARLNFPVEAVGVCTDAGAGAAAGSRPAPSPASGSNGCKREAEPTDAQEGGQHWGKADPAAALPLVPAAAAVAAPAPGDQGAAATEQAQQLPSAELRQDRYFMLDALQRVVLGRCVLGGAASLAFQLRFLDRRRTIDARCRVVYNMLRDACGPAGSRGLAREVIEEEAA